MQIRVLFLLESECRQKQTERQKETERDRKRQTQTGTPLGTSAKSSSCTSIGKSLSLYRNKVLSRKLAELHMATNFWTCPGSCLARRGPETRKIPQRSIIIKHATTQTNKLKQHRYDSPIACLSETIRQERLSRIRESKRKF